MMTEEMIAEDSGGGASSASAAPRATPTKAGAVADEGLAASVGLSLGNAPPGTERDHAPSVPGLESDVRKILEEVKIRERPQFRGAADANNDPFPAQPEEEGGESAPTTPTSRSAPDNPVVPLHTLKDDLQHVIREKKISFVRAVALEEDKRAHGTESAENTHAPQRRRVRDALLVALILVLLGGAALLGVAAVMRSRESGANSALPTNGLLFSEQTIPFQVLDQDPAAIKRLLENARINTTLTLGAISRIAPFTETIDVERTRAQQLLTTGEFFEAIGAQIPGELVRALGDEFFLGFHTVDENAPVLVIPVESYERAFTGMLAWEKTINSDLAPIFTPVPTLRVEANELLVPRTFEDVVMRNFDVRTLKDDAGTIQLYYSFPTRNFLIIAESPYSFAEILARLRAERKL